MQGSHGLKLDEHRSALAGDAAQLSVSLVNNLIADNAEQIAYMLQTYYSREKVSGVVAVPGSALVIDKDSVSLTLAYLKEEYNACSAVDTALRDRMTVTVSREADGQFILKGEMWPEL